MAYLATLLDDVREYLEDIPKKDRDKIIDMMKLLREHDGVLDAQYSKKIRGKIWELRVGFGGSNHRILYVVDRQTVIFLTAFRKKTQKTPVAPIVRAERLWEMYKNLDHGQ